MKSERKPAVRINKRYLTVCYSNFGKNALDRALSSKKKCDGYMIVAQEKGCIVKLYRRRKYNFVSLTPSFLKINSCRGLILEDIEDEEFRALDNEYIVDGSHFVKKLEVKPHIEEVPAIIEVQSNISPNPEPIPLVSQPPVVPTKTQVDWTSKNDIGLRALLMKRKEEFGLFEEGIKTLDRETMIMLLSD